MSDEPLKDARVNDGLAKVHEALEALTPEEIAQKAEEARLAAEKPATES